MFQVPLEDLDGFESPSSSPESPARPLRNHISHPVYRDYHQGS